MELDEPFIPNDILIDVIEPFAINGPNMSGKSTVMRQVALTVILAQMGSFVPAKATIGICDKIFVRVGASDDLSRGRSTFMVEMADIIHLKSSNIKIVADAWWIGRGTSTFDGISIMWAVVRRLWIRFSRCICYSLPWTHTIKYEETINQNMHILFQNMANQ